MPLDLSPELASPPRGSRTSKSSRETIDLSGLEELVGFNIHIIDLLMYQRFYERFGKNAMTPGIFSTLFAIKANPGIRQGALADALMIQRSNMTMLINRLIRAGYVKRQGAKGDNRGVVLSLSEEGEKSLRQIRSKMSAHEKMLSAGLTERERDTCLALLQKMAAHLRATPRKNGSGRASPA